MAAEARQACGRAWCELVEIRSMLRSLLLACAFASRVDRTILSAPTFSQNPVELSVAARVRVGGVEFKEKENSDGEASSA
jgi:hypothetical protein